MSGINDGLLLMVNCLTHAEVLLENHLVELQGGERKVTSSTSPMGLLLQRELELVLEHARLFAGLNPDGGFDPVPPRGERKTVELQHEQLDRKTVRAGAKRKTAPTSAKKRGG